VLGRKIASPFVGMLNYRYFGKKEVELFSTPIIDLDFRSGTCARGKDLGFH